MEIKATALSILVGIILTSCGTTPEPQVVTPTSANENAQNLSPQQITFCKLAIDYPHQSQTNKAEAVVKGRVTCTNEFQNIRKAGSIWLYYRANSSQPWTLVNGRSYQGTVGIDGLNLEMIAVTICKAGEYYGSAQMYDIVAGQVSYPALQSKQSPILPVTCNRT